MKHQITLKAFQDGNPEPTQTETLTIEAESIEEARALAPVFMTLRLRGEELQFFDKNGNELLGNH